MNPSDVQRNKNLKQGASNLETAMVHLIHFLNFYDVSSKQSLLLFLHDRPPSLHEIKMRQSMLCEQGEGNTV
jgi:hypothetical protein